jgi:hypothetical protein
MLLTRKDPVFLTCRCASVTPIEPEAQFGNKSNHRKQLDAITHD